MSIATALNAGINSYMKFEDHKQKKRLRDLQMESYNLKNEGYRMDNRFARGTFDTRVGQEEADLAYKDANAGTAESAERVALGSEDALIAANKSDAAWKAERHRTQQQATRLASNKASKAGTDAWVAAQTAKSDASSTIATNRRDENAAVRDELDTQLDELGTIFEGSGHDPASLVSDPRAKGLLTGVTRAAGFPVKEIQYNDGNFTLVGVSSGDGEGDAVVPADVLLPRVFSNEAQDEVVQGLAQRQGADGVIGEEVAQADQAYEQGVTQINAERANVDKASEAAPALSALRDESVRLKGRIHSLEQQKARGFGSAKTNAPLNDEIEGLEERLEGVSTSIKTYGNQLGNLADMTSEELAARDEQLQGEIESKADTRARTLSDIGSRVQEAGRQSRANPDLNQEQTTRRALGRGPGIASQTALERQGDQVAAAENSKKMADTVRAIGDRIAGRYVKAAKSDPEAFGYSDQDVAEAVSSATNALYDNDAAIQAGAGTAQQQLRTESLLDISVAAGLESRTPAGVFMSGFLSGSDPATIKVAADFAGEDVLSELNPGDRPKAVQTVIQLMERGDADGRQYNATQAKTAVTQMINQGAF